MCVEVALLLFRVPNLRDNFKPTRRTAVCAAVAAAVSRMVQSRDGRLSRCMSR